MSILALIWPHLLGIAAIIIASWFGIRMLNAMERRAIRRLDN